jgi:hypothetical protein
MSMRNLRWKGLAVSVVVVAAVAGATLATTTLLGVTFAGEGSERAEGARPTTRGPGLTICVQAVEIDAAGEAARGDAAIEALAQARVEEALVDVAKHPYWEPAGLAVAPPVVDIGCPSPPLPLVTGPDIHWSYAIPHGYASGPDVAAPSAYRTFVFVMRWEEIDHLLGGLSIRVAPQEFLREGPTASEVTDAVYLTPEEIEDFPFLVDTLEIAFGLQDRYK